MLRSAHKNKIAASYKPRLLKRSLHRLIVRVCINSQARKSFLRGHRSNGVKKKTDNTAPSAIATNNTSMYCCIPSIGRSPPSALRQPTICRLIFACHRTASDNLAVFLNNKSDTKRKVSGEVVCTRIRSFLPLAHTAAFKKSLTFRGDLRHRLQISGLRLPKSEQHVYFPFFSTCIFVT